MAKKYWDMVLDEIKNPKTKRRVKLTNVAEIKAKKNKSKSKKAKKSTKKLAVKRSKESSAGMVIASKTGKRFHRPTCIVVKNVSKKNTITFKNSKEAMKKGYKPCAVCSVKTA